MQPRVKPSVTIVIPTYNELGNILRLITAIKKFTKTLPWKVYIHVIDDNSPDQTGVKTEKFFNSDKSVKVTIRTKDRGLATAVLVGIHQAITDYVLFMDADFNHDPKYLPQMLTLVRKNPNRVVSASRYISGGGMDKKEQFAGSRLVNLFGKWFLKARVYDFTGGYLLIKKTQLSRLPLTWIFRGYGEWGVRLQYSLQRANIEVQEFPVFYPLRTYGQSKTRLFEYAFVLLKAFWDTRFHYPR